MRKIFALTMAAAMFTATPAMAGNFDGFRLGATAGVDDVTAVADTTDVTYGAEVGFDAEVLDGVLVGVEATVDNVFDRRDVAAAARLGVEASDNVLVYGKVGYSNFKDVFSRELDGLRVGGGLEFALNENLYAKVEYRYTDFEANVGKHGGLVGVGVRF